MNAKDFISIPKLYHYTTFDNAIKIVLGKSLKFGRLPFMNDYLESNKMFGCSIHTEKHVLDTISKEILSYQQISLTMDSKSKLGFDISAMWGHYADKNHGVCIVFDKNKLVEILKKQNCLYNAVQYRKDACRWYSIMVEKNRQVKPYIQHHIYSIFFRKTPDWGYEQEFRIISQREGDSFLPIEDSIIGVILNGHALSHEEIELKENLLKELKVNVITYCNQLFSNEIYLSCGEEQIYPQETIVSLAPPEMWRK